jgi:hypothetical protein
MQVTGSAKLASIPNVCPFLERFAFTKLKSILMFRYPPSTSFDIACDVLKHIDSPFEYLSISHAQNTLMLTLTKIFNNYSPKWSLEVNSARIFTETRSFSIYHNKTKMTKKQRKYF